MVSWIYYYRCRWCWPHQRGKKFKLLFHQAKFRTREFLNVSSYESKLKIPWINYLIEKSLRRSLSNRSRSEFWILPPTAVHRLQMHCLSFWRMFHKKTSKRNHAIWTLECNFLIALLIDKETKENFFGVGFNRNLSNFQ